MATIRDVATNGASTLRKNREDFIFVFYLLFVIVYFLFIS